MDLPSQKSAHGEDSELKLMQTAHQEGIHHVESITVPAQDAKRIERLVVLKQDLTIVLLLSGCAFFNFLDRAALGNARLMSFQTDLHLSNPQFYNCLMMIYVGYMSFELPAALSLRVAHPPFLYGSAVIFFGVCTVCTSAARTYASVMVLRLLLGFGESFVQTGFVFLSLWYTKEEMTTRCAFFFGSTPLAGAFSGLIAYGINKNLDGRLGRAAWEWYFLIEGCLTIFWGLLVFSFLPKLPETIAKSGSWLFRSQAEHAVMMRRTINAHNTPDAKPKLSQILLGLRDIKTWLGAMVIGAFALNVAAFSSFLPTFIREFGFPTLQSQLMSMIPYLLAAITLPALSILSDKIQKKAIVVLLCSVVILVGFIMVLASTDKAVLLVGCCLIGGGSYPGLVISASWQMQSHAGFSKRATAWALSQVFIQSYSIVSSQIYTTPPRYFKGHGVLLGLNAVGLLAGALNYSIMKKANSKMDQRALEYERRGIEDPDNEKSYEELCDAHPKFRYAL